MIAPRPWRLRPFAQQDLSTALPELYALQHFVERSDWHNDTPFAQSVRLHDWIATLPGSLEQTIVMPEGMLTRFLNHPFTADSQHSYQMLLAFAALIHDVGKTATFEKNPDGTTRCPGHELVSGRMSTLICRRFDFTPTEADWITHLVREHGQPYNLYKTLSPLPPEEQEYLWMQFKETHEGYLRPLLLLAYGDLVTSHMAAIRPAKYDAILHFYHNWLRRL